MTFLANTWQRHPALFSSAFPDVESPVSAEELAGFALLEDAESRLVSNNPDSDRWQLRHGPFEESDFTRLPASHWTLLVQQMERFVPQLRALQGAFRFLPRWRMDDVMVSYAAPHGSVGPHVDEYDVFLLQLSGQRHWSIANDYDPTLVPDQEQAVLAQFEAEQSWMLKPGDMLYLPPGVAHHGVAAAEGGPCITASLGFRAPALSDLLFQLAELQAESPDSSRFSDPGRKPVEQPGNINSADLQRFRRWLQTGLQLGDAQLAQLVGCLVTQSHRQFWDYSGREAGRLEGSQSLIPDRDCRWAWSDVASTENPESDATLIAQLFCQGQAYPMDRRIARSLANDETVDQACDTLDDASIGSLESLLQQGHISAETDGG